MTIKNTSNITNGENVNANYFFVVNTGALFNMSSSYLSYAGWSSNINQTGLVIYSNGAVVYNSTFNNNYRSIVLSSSINSNITYNKIFTSSVGGDGINLLGASNSNSILLNQIDTSLSSSSGIVVFSSYSNNISSNNITIRSTSSSGILFTSSGNNNASNNNITIFGPFSYGIYVFSDSNANKIFNNKVITSGSSSDGIRIFLTNNNNFSYNNITTNDVSSNGVSLISNSSGNLFYGDNINSSNLSINFNGGAFSVTNNIFTGVQLNNLSSQIYSDSNAYNNILLNSTFNESRITFGATGTNNITIKWYARVNVTNLNGTPLQGALVNVSDLNNNLESSQSTDSQGLTSWNSVTDKVKILSGDILYNNHTINVSKGSSKIGSYYNITQSMQINIVMDVENPLIAFISPTRNDGATIYENYTPTSVPVNISINESNLANFIYNWNGINYSFYDDRLVLMMNFNNVLALGENSAQVTDLSKYKNNGSVKNGLEWLVNGGRNSGGFNFTGTNYSAGSPRYINLSNPITNATQNWTFSTWIKPYYNGNPDKQHIINLYGLFDGWIYWDGRNANTNYVGLTIRNPADQVIFSNINSVPQGQWSFITMTREDVGSSHNFKIYVNGLYQNGVSVTGTITSNNPYPSMIGAHLSYGSTQYLSFNGSIDDLMVFNRTFSQNEIQQLYMSNLYKYDINKWNFFANQTNLTFGDYTYYGYANDSYGGANSTETRVLHFVGVVPNISFVPPTYANDTTISDSYAPVNISINESNLANFVYNWNGTNYSLYDDGLLFMMNLNNNSLLGENNTSFVDVGKYGNSGNCTLPFNCPTLTNLGKFGNAYRFDGGDAIIMNYSQNISPLTKNFSVSAWINVTSSSTSNHKKIVCLARNVSVNGWCFGLYSTPQNNLTFTAFGVADYRSNYIPPLNQWVYLTATINESKYLTFYVNGGEFSQGYGLTNVIASNDDNFLIGGTTLIGSSTLSPDGFIGSIDEVRIWNRSLSAQEVRQLYLSNLYKYDFDKWNFFANQTNLTLGDYTYYGYANDSYGGANSTGVRVLHVRNTAPQIKSLAITPSPAYTKDSLNCTFNINDADQTNLNVNVSWRRNGAVILNQTVSGYQNDTLASVNLSRDLTYHDDNINCSIVAFDIFESNSSSTAIIIQNYTTSILTTQSAPVINQPITFTANYSSGVIGDVKQLIHNSTDLDTNDISHSIKVIDMNTDGIPDGYVLGNGSNFAAFAFNGSLLWVSATIPYPKYAIRLGDIDKDNQSEILGINYYDGDLFIFNMAGGLERTIDPGVSWGESLELGDINGDGQLDIIFGLGSGNGLFAYNSSGQQFWSNTALGALVELQLYDKNIDGVADYIAGSLGGRLFLINATNGSQIWNNTDTGEDASIFMDINNDNISEILYGRYNSGGGDGIRFSNLTSGSIVSFSPFSSYTPWVSRDLVKTDLNGDGKDDLLFVYLDSQNPQHNNLRAINNSNAVLWTYILPTLSVVYNMKIANIDDDIQQELITGGDSSTLNAFDINATNATTLLSYVWNVGSIGNDLGYSEAIDTGDSNKDGIADVVALSTNGIVYITQPVSCKIAFNDSVSADMIWNTTSRLWSYNRTFVSTGIYLYNTTCEKGGYQTKVNNTSIFIGNTLPTVTLYSPLNNTPLINRTPMLVWNGTDLDGKSDIKAYEINITCYYQDGSTCTDDNRYIIVNTGSPVIENYTLLTPLKYLADRNYYYTWKVRANDTVGFGTWSDEWRFNVTALIDINLTNLRVNFGLMLPNEINDTSDGSPLPFALENLGNVLVNVSINATNLWLTQPNPSQYFQYKFDNRSEPGSFNWFLSQTAWKNVPTQGEVKNALAYLGWQNANDAAEIDINVTVPGAQEGAGIRSSTINFTASLAE